MNPKNKVRVTELNDFRVHRDEIPTKVRILMLKGEKGEKGDPGGYESSYDRLMNKPKINDVTLEGNKSLDDLGVLTLTNLEIEEIVNKN